MERPECGGDQVIPAAVRARAAGCSQIFAGADPDLGTHRTEAVWLRMLKHINLRYFAAYRAIDDWR